MYPPGKVQNMGATKTAGNLGKIRSTQKAAVLHGPGCPGSGIPLLHQNIMVLQIPVILKPSDEKSPLGASDYLVQNRHPALSGT